METQVVLNGVRGVEDGPTGSDNQDKTVESLWAKQSKDKDGKQRPANNLGQLSLMV